MSNSNGLISYIIGEGNASEGQFAEIDWSAGPYFLKTEADPMGGTDYTITGVTKFHSVPYALYAESFSGLEELLARIESLEEALEIGDPEPGTVTDIDGHVYPTVIIGNQEWMAENLRVTRYNNEDVISTGLSNAEWESTTEGAYAIYNNDDDMLQAYGKLYNWYAVDDSRGLCPQGWSVPSDADWTALVNYVVSGGFPNELENPNGAGNALKSCRQVGHPDGGDCDTSEHPRWNSHDTHSGFDEFGFSALPCGHRWSGGNFGGVGGYGGWWSATGYSSTSAWSRSIYSSNGSVDRYGGSKALGFSVRCFRDID